MSNPWTIPEEPPSLILGDAPDLSDQTASEVLEFLYQLVNAFEGRYGPQLRHYYQDCQSRESQPDLFDNFEDDLPTF